jgi:hypothetical protein
MGAAALGFSVLSLACFLWTARAAGTETPPDDGNSRPPKPVATGPATTPAGNDRKFFGLEVPDRRTVFVLDYSKSMEERNCRQLVEAELGKALLHLKETVSYQVILFAGYAWIPGDKVALAENQMSATVTDASGRTFSWLRPSKASFEWQAIDGGNKHFLRPVPWQRADATEIAKTVAGIKGSSLQMNTSWQFPLEMALAMRPTPEALYFLTDGITGDKDSKRLVATLSKTAFSTRTHINTISMMEPTQIQALKDLGKNTSGGFSIVNTDGTSQVIFPEKLR